MKTRMSVAVLALSALVALAGCSGDEKPAVEANAASSTPTQTPDASVGSPSQNLEDVDDSVMTSGDVTIDTHDSLLTIPVAEGFQAETGHVLTMSQAGVKSRDSVAELEIRTSGLDFDPADLVGSVADLAAKDVVDEGSGTVGTPEKIELAGRPAARVTITDLKDPKSNRSATYVVTAVAGVGEDDYFVITLGFIDGEGDRLGAALQASVDAVAIGSRTD